MNISEKRLKLAICKREFIPFYQPIVDASSHRIAGCEVLARWLMPEKGIVGAGEFISEIEKYKLLNQLTCCLVADVYADFRDNDVHCSKKLLFALTLNITLTLLMEPLFQHWLVSLTRRLREVGVSPVYEITEREDINAFPQAGKVFDDLAKHQVCFAVDDYGSGYATENLVSACQPSYVKIDRQYVMSADTPASREFIEKTILLAESVGARVIAEGIETDEQAQRLTALGVHYLQGYYYGCPMPFQYFHHHLRFSHEMHTPHLPVAQ